MSYLMTFNIPFGRYRFLRIPFGINCSQDQFIRNYVWKHIVCLEGLASVQVIVDDSVVFGKARREHETNLDKFLQRCQAKDIKLSIDKLEIGEERAGCFALFVFLVSHDCCVTLTHDATGLSAVCDCGISCSYSLSIFGSHKIPYFGQALTSNVLKIDTYKAKAIENVLSPTSKSELQTAL